MAARQSRRTPPSALAVALVLVLLSASGMLTGMAARRLQAPPTASPAAHATTPTRPPAPPTSTVQPTATAASQTTPADNNVQFTLSIAASPKTVAPGQRIDITVTAWQKGTQIPLLGVLCYLRSPSGGGQGLFSPWPAPVATNGGGQAFWHLTVPDQPPGTYRVETVAYGAHSYYYRSYTSVTVTG
jgi:hypothetical protein